MSNPVKTTLAFCLLALVAAPASWSKGSAADGALKTLVCTACHGPNGNSANPEWPVLAGQNAAYIERQLHLLHDGKRVGKVGDAAAALMPPMALMLADQDIEDVAAFFASQVPTPREGEATTATAGRNLYRYGDRARGVPACAACHGPAGHGNPVSGYPALRLQQPLYLTKQLSAFSSGARYTKNEKGASNGGDNATIMQTIASRLTEADMRDLAAYIQGIH
jgi:cytochrome c553